MSFDGKNGLKVTGHFSDMPGFLTSKNHNLVLTNIKNNVLKVVFPATSDLNFVYHLVSPGDHYRGKEKNLPVKLCSFAMFSNEPYDKGLNPNYNKSEEKDRNHI